MLLVCMASLDDIAYGVATIPAYNIADVIGKVDESANAFEDSAACDGVALGYFSIP